MGIKTCYSVKKTIDEIIVDINGQAQGLDAKMVLYFASSKFDQVVFGDKMKKAFAGSTVIGCSTAGEIVSGKMLKESVVVMILGSDIIDDVNVRIIEDVKSQNTIPEAFKAFEEYYKTSMSTMDINEYVGLILIDGLSVAEERIMDKIGNLTNVNFIGGSAGDDLGFKATYVCADGEVYTNAAVLALMKPATGFDIIKTQSFKNLDIQLTATKVDEASRTVFEFNGKPAAKAYAEALEIDVAEAEDRFMSNPLGLMVGDEPFVRSPQKIVDGGIVFYCNIIEGMDLNILESGDIVKDTSKAIQVKEKDLGGIAGIINFHCILRTLELEKKDLTREYGEIFSDINTIGFSTYGEEFLGHINQTATMLVFQK